MCTTVYKCIVVCASDGSREHCMNRNGSQNGNAVASRATTCFFDSVRPHAFLVASKASDD